MKVVKQGKPQWPREAKCKCDAVLSVDKKDVLTYCAQGYDYLGDANGPELRGVKCPNCSRYIEVGEGPV